ncbi:hypothetical protein GOP47_0019820 [Adiantum capillus-veneris]|uniref:D-2-hydroxyglutarate dehydrogenase n=1 Tax=Adiantum capillus-veneris TaxID=13818 RepID=A0A9D4Z8U3_ADICA|nr:hypothetical protein GOP47_0019820 [Adiantum capillus-veneris]
MVDLKLFNASPVIDARSEEQPFEFFSNCPSLGQKRHSSHIPATDRVRKDSRYVKTFRDPRYSTLENEDLVEFKKIVGDTGVLTEAFELEAANTDWLKKYFGSSKVLLRPTSTQQVSEILKYCNARKLAVVPQGGNTGLVGGSVPVFDEVVLSLGAMNKIVLFDELNGILVCEAGCILENLDNYLLEKGYMMPLDFGAKGSCQIGGNISTNAGGVHLLRYGSLRANVLGLEIVLANGEVIDSLRTLRKDNTGYDLKQLFIGAEGTLGVVTKVSILTPPRLSSKNVAFLSCGSFVDCQKILKEAKSRLGEILSAFEFMDRHALDMVLKHSGKSRDPLPASKHTFYLLVETTGSFQNHDREKLDKFLEACMENGLVADGVVAQDNQQFTSFWHLREGVTEALSKEGAVYKYDLSIPVPHLYSVVEDLQKRLGDLAIVMGYGHLGDGNLHLNISTPQYDEKILALIEPFVYEWTASHEGSVSAEHGLGFMKADAIYYSKSPELVQWMAKFKQIFDSNGILNPYKVLPPSALKETSPSY